MTLVHFGVLSNSGEHCFKGSLKGEKTYLHGFSFSFSICRKHINTAQVNLTRIEFLILACSPAPTVPHCSLSQ